MPSPLRGGGGVDIPKDVASRLLRIDYGRDATGNRLRAPASRSPNNLRAPSMRMRQEYFVESSASIDNFVSAEEFPELAHLIKVRASLPPTNPLPSPSPPPRSTCVMRRREGTICTSSGRVVVVVVVVVVVFLSTIFCPKKKTKNIQISSTPQLVI